MTTIIYGDSSGQLETNAKSQKIEGIDWETIEIYGDAPVIINSRGGNDKLIGGENFSANGIMGDAYTLINSHGGNDHLYGVVRATKNSLFGDALFMEASQGGNDKLIGGASSIENELYGDGKELHNSQGGNDQLYGSAESENNHIYGDALELQNSVGGNDVLVGGLNANNYLYGDSCIMWSSNCGDDVLIAGDTSKESILYGDVKAHYFGNSIFGNDRLISGTGNDKMFGDFSVSNTEEVEEGPGLIVTGRDVFVFSANNGADTIYDFRHGEDKIELQGVGVNSFGALSAGGHLSVAGADSVISFGSNTITLVGVTELTAEDFLFT